MGRLTEVIKYVAGTVNKLLVTLGAGHQRTLEIITPSGYESKPLPGDKAFVVEGRRTGSYKHIGVQSGKGANSLKEGEARVFSRDADGEIVASVTLFADGETLIGNANGTVLLKADGSINANGAVITPDGDVVSALGISLNTHTHTFVGVGPGNPGVTGGPQ